MGGGGGGGREHVKRVTFLREGSVVVEKWQGNGLRWWCW